MEVGKAIYDILTNNSPVNTIIAGSVYPSRFKITKNRPSLPYIVYQVVSDLPTIVKNNASTYDYVTVQITLVANNYEDIIDLSGKVRTALDYVSGTFQGVVVDKIFFQNSNEIFNDTSGLSGIYQISHDYQFNINR